MEDSLHIISEQRSPFLRSEWVPLSLKHSELLENQGEPFRRNNSRPFRTYLNRKGFPMYSVLYPPFVRTRAHFPRISERGIRSLVASDWKAWAAIRVTK